MGVSSVSLHAKPIYVCTSSVSLHAKALYTFVHPVLVYMLSPYLRMCIQF